MAVAAVTVLGVVAGIRRPPPPALDVRDLDAGGRLLGTIRLDERATFQLLFTHSMYGGDVAETYQVAWSGPAAPSLVRSTVRTTTGGAAEYYARYGNFRRDGDGWIVQTDPLQVPRLRLVVDKVGAPRVRVGERETPLLSLVPEGQLVELRLAGGPGR